MTNDAKSLSHTKWNCKYHIVFAPKYRRKVFFKEKREAIGKILRQLCEWKGVEIHEAEICPDHVHMLVSIPPKGIGVEFYGIPERKGQPDGLRAIRRSEIQIPRTRILVSRILRRYGWKEQTENCRIHQTSHDKEKFLRGNESDIILFEAAAKELKRLGAVPLPTTERMKAEMDALTARKAELKTEQQQPQRVERQYAAVQQNVDEFLSALAREQQQRKQELE